MLNLRFRKSLAALSCLVAVAGMVATPADARRGGSFGSRGSRSYYAPRATSVSPYQVAPVQRSMTQRSFYAGPQASSPWRTQEPGPIYPQGQPVRRFGGFGGGLVGGLLAGGLIGAMMGGHGGWGMGYGGMGVGFLISLIQLLLVGGLIWFAIGLFRGRSGSGASYLQRAPDQFNRFVGSTQPSPWAAPAAGEPMVEIAVTEGDKIIFERMLSEVQEAFGREDYAKLRELTTPEIMSYLSEELSQNATSGRRNEVRNTRLIDAEVSECWRESGTEYATIAMRYESIDVMLDRSTGAVVSGDPVNPSQTTEVWTFLRPIGGAWKLAAIQE